MSDVRCFSRNQSLASRSVAILAVLCVFTLNCAGCGDGEVNSVVLTEDEKEAAERKAVERLKELGCKVEEREDELIQTSGVLVKLASEHFDKSGKIRADVFREFGAIRNLFLILDSTPVSSEGLKELRQLNNLLLLSATRTATGDEGLAQIEGIVSLRLLRLNWTSITDHGLRHIERLPDLVMLYLSGTKITDDAMEHLRKLSGLKALKLSHTELTDTGAASFTELPELQFLGVDDTDLTDQSVSVLSKLQHLRYLNLDETKITLSKMQELKEALPECGIVMHLRRKEEGGA